MARGRPSTVIVDSAELAAFNDELDDLAESSQRTTAGDIHRLDSRTDENDSSSASSDGPSLGTIRTAAAAGLDEYVTNLKRQCRLGVEAESRLDTFVQTTGPGLNIHTITLAAWCLEGQELAQTIRRELRADWKMSPITETNCVNAARGVILSGHLTSYRSDSVEVIYRFLSDNKLCPLPSDLDTASRGTVRGTISTAATRFRCQLKTFIGKSLERNSPLRNLSDLADALLGESDVQKTVLFMMRLASLRAFYVSAPSGRSDKVFWPAYDNQSALLYARSELVVHAHLKAKFLADQELYGQVDASTLIAADARSPFQLAIDRYAATVKRPVVQLNTNANLSPAPSWDVESGSPALLTTTPTTRTTRPLPRRTGGTGGADGQQPSSPSPRTSSSSRRNVSLSPPRMSS